MGSIVAGSTYLLAPPPKSYHHSHLIASILCHPIKHPHLLLQLQRKDRDARHAFPQFDLLCRKAVRVSKKESSASVNGDQSSHRPREVGVQESETGRKVAAIKYMHSFSAAQKRKYAVVDEELPIAVIYWNFGKSIVKEWTIHRYESKKRGYKSVGYEFRLQDVIGRDGKPPHARWTKKIPVMPDRPNSMISTRSRRSSSVSSASADGPRRRHTYPASPSKPTLPTEPKWEFASANVKRVYATLTSQRLHINSISSTATPMSSPSNSDIEDDFFDREVTTGRILEFLIVSALFVGLEEDFASKLRQEFLTAPGHRIPQPDDVDDSASEEFRPPRRARPIRVNSPTPRAPTESLKSPTRSTIPPPIIEIPLEPVKTHSRMKSISSARSAAQSMSQTTYASRSWGYLSSAAHACVSKLWSIGAS